MFQHADGALMSVFADDVLLVCRRSEKQQLLDEIREEVRIKWTGELADYWVRYLGKLWRRLPTGEVLVCLPPDYWTGVLVETGLQDCKPLSTPTEVRRDTADGALLTPAEHALFRRVVGKLMYASTCRPDLSFATKQLARRVAQPNHSDWVAMRRLLRYVKGTQEYVLQLKLESEMSEEILVFADSDFAGGEDRKSTTGGVIFYHGMLVACWSRTQTVVALSTAEAELIALSTAAQEGLFLRHVLDELGVTAPLCLYTDSSAAQAVTLRRGCGRIKHLAVRQMWVQDLLRTGELQVGRVSSAENLADLFTKGLPTARHQHLTAALGVKPFEDPRS